MKTLSDLTLSQLTAVYSAVSGTPVKAKFFNSRQTGRRRVEALLSEKGLTLADALLAAGFTTETAPVAEETKAEAPEIEADTDVSEPELTSPAWDEVQPEIEIDAKLDAAPEDSDASTAEVSETPDLLSVAVILTSNQVVNDTRDMLVRYLLDSAGLDPENAVRAAIRAVKALKLPEQAPLTTTSHQPRTGTKQEQVISMLRRPEGATIDQMVSATRWQVHTCRGFLAGAVKKRLGMNISSDKDVNGQRVYRAA